MLLPSPHGVVRHALRVVRVLVAPPAARVQPLHARPLLFLAPPPVVVLAVHAPPLLLEAAALLLRQLLRVALVLEAAALLLLPVLLQTSFSSGAPADVV